MNDRREFLKTLGIGTGLVARAEAGGLPLSAMIKDDERCIRCGLCAIRCPTDAMTMERFTITERLLAGSPAGTTLETEPEARTARYARR